MSYPTHRPDHGSVAGNGAIQSGPVPDSHSRSHPHQPQVYPQAYSSSATTAASAQQPHPQHHQHHQHHQQPSTGFSPTPAPAHLARRTAASNSTATSSSGFTNIDPSQLHSTSSSSSSSSGKSDRSHSRPPARPVANGTSAGTGGGVSGSIPSSGAHDSHLGPTSSPKILFTPGLLMDFINFVHGSISLALVLLQIALTGKPFKRLTQQDTDAVDSARNKIWSLSHKPYGSLYHRFLTLPTGFRLHYVTTAPAPLNSSSADVSSFESTPSDPKNLVIFIHGFPDSWHVWNNQLRSATLASSAILVAMDLPGYGGSDSLPDYSADQLLNTVALAIAALRDRYLVPSFAGSGPRPRVIVVSHDWGTIISYRLASEAPALADRHVTMNCPHGPVFQYNLKDHLVRGFADFGRFLKSPLRNLPSLLAGFAAFGPVLDQARKSWYVSAFQLPVPIAQAINTIGDSFNRTAQPSHKFFFRRVVATEASPDLSRRYDVYDPECAVSVASGIGPGIQECLESTRMASKSDATSEQAYPPSVRLRAPSGGWMDNIGVYRGKSMFTPWHRSPEVELALSRITASPAVLSWVKDESVANRARGKFGVPVTALWGTEDLALNADIAVDYIEKWFVRAQPDRTTTKIQTSSQLVKLPGMGHWLPTADYGKDVVTETVIWAVSTFANPERTPTLKEWLTTKFPRHPEKLIFIEDTASWAT